MDLRLTRNNNSTIGYSVRLRLNLRGSKEFLLGVKRSLEQHQIHTTFKEKEHSWRPKPILIIGGIKELHKVKQLVPVLPDAKNEWADFRTAVNIISNKKHSQLEGMEELMKIKGVI